MSETSQPASRNTGYCLQHSRGLAREPGIYPCSRQVIYEQPLEPTPENPDPDIEERLVACSKMLRVTNEVSAPDSKSLSRLAGTEMTAYESHLEPNPNVNPEDANIGGHACLEPPLQFPYLCISVASSHRR